MKNYIIIAALGLLTSVAALAGETSPADQKWLTVVQKMIAEGKTTVSTPQKERVDLLKDWAGKNGYTVEENKTENGYTLKFAKKNLASK